MISFVIDIVMRTAAVRPTDRPNEARSISAGCERRNLLLEQIVLKLFCHIVDSRLAPAHENEKNTVESTVRTKPQTHLHAKDSYATTITTVHAAVIAAAVCWGESRASAMLTRKCF